jgi:alginate lyase
MKSTAKYFCRGFASLSGVCPGRMRSPQAHKSAGVYQVIACGDTVESIVNGKSLNNNVSPGFVGIPARARRSSRRKLIPNHCRRRRTKYGLSCKMKLIARIAMVCFLFSIFSSAVSASEVATNLPKVFCADPQALVAAKSRLAAGDQSLQPALRRLLSDADKLLIMKPPSVMEKKQLPPSGDKHDFMSQAPYFWRDTNSPDGSYVRRDGQRNPESSEDFDAGNLGKVCSSAHTLALAFYFSGDEKYAAKAVEIIRVWFLDAATRMNPNLNYGQGIPGGVEGRPEGLISARGMVGLMDALGLLAESKSWTPADQQEMTAWVGKYFDWLATNKLARQEGAASNNHGTFYDTQFAALALFLGKTDTARELLLKDRDNRIAKQIEPDGRQPRELARTLSFDYSLFNLQALSDLASLGQNAGVDLWHYQTSDGRSILKALKLMAMYADPEKTWPYKQIHKPNRDDLGELLVRASGVYPGNQFGDALKFYPADKFAENQARLLYAPAQTSGNVQ